LLAPFLSRRFLRFAVVGASGVVVNVGTLAALRRLAGVQANVASAIAIEASILSNFALNHKWTFRDRRSADVSTGRQLVQFHLVSAVGASVQFLAFVALNVFWLLLDGGAPALRAYNGADVGFVARWIVHPLAAPPPVGSLIYLSQVLGIGLAMAWNFLINFHWTWAPRRSQSLP
jgi:putative flippase GtrA